MSNSSAPDLRSLSARPPLRASTQKAIRPNPMDRPSAFVFVSHVNVEAVLHPRNTLPFPMKRNSTGGVPPSADTLNVTGVPPTT